MGAGAWFNYPFLTLKERDNETGLDYFGARYYSSTQGRYTSPDLPLMDQWESNPQSWNLYSYVRNNPLRLVDPTGNAAEVPCDKICQESKKRAEEERKKAEEEGIDTITIPMVDSGVPRDGGGPNLTIAEALQEQEDRRRSFIVNNVAAGVGYGIGRVFKGIGSLFSRKPATITVPNAASNLDDLLRPGGNLIGKAGSDATIREVQGGAAEAKAFFDKLTQGGLVRSNPSYPGTLVTLSNGGTVGIRTVASNSPGTAATVDVNVPGVFRGKIKFNP